MENRAIYKRAIDTWGVEAQELMVFEEMAELQKAICKAKRGADNRNSIAEEIADVEIMLEQLKIMFDCGELTAGWKTTKMARLEERLNQRSGEDK